MDIAEKIAHLKLHGYQVGWASREDAARLGYVASTSLHAYAEVVSEEPYVDLGDIAAADDQPGWTSTWQRSNYRLLMASPGHHWTPLSSSPILGAFVGDLTDADMRTVGSLTDCLVLDEHDLAELEDEEIHASYLQYLESSLMWPVTDTAVRDRLDDWSLHTTDEERQQAFFEAMQDSGYYPEHTGLDVRWDYRRATEILLVAAGIAVRIES